MKQKRCNLPKLTKQVRAQTGFGFQLRSSCLHPRQQAILNLKLEVKKGARFSQLLDLPQGWGFSLVKKPVWMVTPNPSWYLQHLPGEKLPLFLFFPYELLHNKVSVFHNQNYKPSPNFSSTTVLERLFTVNRRSYSSAVLHPCWKTAL